MTYCWSLSCTVFELFDVEEYRDLEIWVRGHSRSFKLVPFESLDGVSYSPCAVTMAESLTVYEIFSVKVLRDLENLVRGCSRSLKLAPFDRSRTTFYWNLGAISCSPSIVTISLSCISSEIKPDIGGKSWFFHTPLHSTPPVKGSPLEYCHPVWYGKTRMVRLPDGEKTLRISITV